MAMSGFGPYHGLWIFEDAPTKCIGVIHTPWVINRRQEWKTPAHRRFCMVGIVRELHNCWSNSPHKHHHHGGAVCPSYMA
jgi:hypothetical protein